MTLLIKSFMTKTPHSIEPGQKLMEAKKRMMKYGCEHLPVLSGRQIVGVISDRDILFVNSLNQNHQDESITVGDVMITEVFTVDENTSVAEVIKIMLEKNIGSMLITKKDELSGIFTATDMGAAFLHLLNSLEAPAA